MVVFNHRNANKPRLIAFFMAKPRPIVSGTQSSEGYVTLNFTFNTINPTSIQRIIDHLSFKQFRPKYMDDILVPVSDVEVIPSGTKTKFAVKYIVSCIFN